MKINWKVRIKNPVWWAQMGLAIMTPILAYTGITAGEIYSWDYLKYILLEAMANPYVVALVLVSAWNALNDPTTKGVTDSERAMTYTEPK